jgi:flagellar hook-associated protein 3 FlgL
MRVSNQMLLQDALRSLRNNLESLYRSEQEVATGQRVRTISDDPLDASRIARISAHLRDIDQYRRNIASANMRLSTEDVVLTGVLDLLQQAKGVALGVDELDASESALRTAVAEVTQIRTQLVALGNTRLGNEYIFGGARTTTPPFLTDGTYVGDGTVRQMEIDQGILLETNHTGDQAIGEAIAVLDGLLEELEGGDHERISESVRALEVARQQNLVAQTEVGLRLSQLQQIQDQLARRSLNLTNRRSELQDADPNESVVGLMAHQQALERAYAVISRIASMSITDYLA